MILTNLEERAGLNILTLILNVLTVFALLGVLCVAAVFINIFFVPSTVLNPFPPPTLVPTDCTADGYADRAAKTAGHQYT